MISRSSYKIIIIAILTIGNAVFGNCQQNKDGDAAISAHDVEQAFRNTGKEGQHPRLFFNEDDIKRVKILLKQNDPIINLGFENLKKDAANTLKQPLLTYHLDDANLRIPSIHIFAVQLPALVMMYQLTADTTYAARVWRQLEQMIAFPDWGADRHFLDAGIGAFDFALSYDALYNYFTEEQRTLLKQAIIKNVMVPARTQLEKRTWWATANHNWNGICNGSIIMAALAMFEDDPKGLSQIVAMAANGLPHYIHSFEPDGQSEEGLMYWSYGLMYTTIAFESMLRTLGTTFHLDEEPGFQKTGWFPLYVSGPVTSLSFGDDPVKNKRSHSFFWFAKRNHDSALAKLQYDLCIETGDVSWMDMLYYEPSLIGKGNITASLPTNTYVRGIDVMALRENWNKDSWFISMHGGRNNANHGHLDAGSFDIQGDGEVWAYGDLGRDDYTYPGYFSKTTLPGYLDSFSKQSVPGRWHFYRLRAEGKNCLVFNPSVRPDQNEMGDAKLVGQSSNTKGGFYMVDLTDCYSRDVKKYLRGIKMVKVHQMMTVQDEFVAQRSSDVWWGMHTKADIKISKDGRVAELMQNGKKLKARITSPANASFMVLPASYLPNETFPLTKNSSNKEFSKLAIHLKDVKQATIRVDFTPSDSKMISTTITSLLNWKE